jgi:hypothetical protein
MSKGQKKVLNHVEPYQSAQNNSEKKFSWREKQNYGYLSKLLKIELPTCEILLIGPTIITIKNTQHRVHIAYLFFNCWKFEKLDLKLSNLFFK